MTKKEILHKCIDEEWPIKNSQHNDLRNKLAKLSSWGIEHKAMDEYAKQEAIGFAEWIIKEAYWFEDNWYIRGDVFNKSTTEQLYTIYQNSKQL